MGLKDWIQGLWMAGLALQLLLGVSLVLRKTWRKLPFFSAYALCGLVGDATLYFLLRNRTAYLYGYSVYEALSVVLALAVIYEVFTQLLLSHVALRRMARLALHVSCALLLLLGMVVLYTHAPIGAKGLVSAVLVVEEASRILEVGLVIFLFGFSTAFGLHWRQNIFGVALGLGMLATVKLATITLLPNSYVTAGAVNVAVMFSSDFTLLIWIAYLLAPEKVTNTVDLPKTAQLERWNQAIMELIHQ